MDNIRITSGLYQDYIRIISRLHQDYIGIISGLYEDCMRIVWGLYQDFIRIILQLYQDCMRIYEDYIRIASGLYRDYIRIVWGLYEDYIRIASGLYQDYIRMRTNKCHPSLDHIAQLRLVIYCLYQVGSRCDISPKTVGSRWRELMKLLIWDSLLCQFCNGQMGNKTGIDYFLVGDDCWLFSDLPWLLLVAEVVQLD